MKFIPLFYLFFLISPFLYSCNGNRCEEYSSIEDSFIMEDFFEIEILSPNNDTKKAIGEYVSSFIRNSSDYCEDTLNIEINCFASWEPSRNDNPYLININEIDTDWFYLTINEGESTENSINWAKRKDRQILQPIKEILEAGTFYIFCDNCDVSPQNLLDRYFAPMVKTEIICEMRLPSFQNKNSNK